MRKLIGIVLIVLAANASGFAQCNGFAKKSMSKLKPYLNTQQVFSTVLLNGDKTQVNQTFYYGDEYRLLITADEKLGKIQLNIRDNTGTVIFTTKAYGTIMWDFNVESTQDLTLEVVTPPAPAGQTVDASGCVAIVVGFK